MYKHILVAVDLTKESSQVVNKAIGLQKIHSSHLSFVHVIEPAGYAYPDISINIGEIHEQLKTTSDLKLAGLVEDNNLTSTSCATLTGRATSAILSYADDNNADLIVTGSHGRHGVQLLLGSTANGILHGAKCDVLAVRIKP